MLYIFAYFDSFWVFKSNGVHPKYCLINILCLVGIMRREGGEKVGNLENKEVTVEAVIEFDIQPFYKLMRIQYIQMLLRKAVMEYIHSNEDTSSKYYFVPNTALL